MMKFIKLLYFTILFFIFSLIKINNFSVYSLENLASNNIEKVAYLTFDDGPSRNTVKILKILENYEINATFFFIGENIKPRYEPVLKDLLDKNNYIGLHSMKHDFKTLYSVRNCHINFVSEMLEEQILIYNITNSWTYLVRPPFSGGNKLTDKHVEQLVKYDFKVWDWNIDSKDWNSKTVQQVIRNVNNDLKLKKHPDKIIVLMHEKNISVKALPYIIEILKKQGYTFKVYNPDDHFMMNFRNIDTI